MMASRKAVLDKNKQHLLDSVNASNKIYNNEELSILVGEMQNKIKSMEQEQSTVLNRTYPVGSIYISYSSTNPGSLFGGTWVAYATGRTLVGVDASQTEFNTIGKTGGEKTHTLTTAEMPTHTGHYDYWNAYSGSGYYLNSNKLIDLGVMLPFNNRPWKVTAGNELDVQTVSKGGNEAHNNLQPYITVYMWRRTA